MSKFKDHWNSINKTHDIPIQEELDDVKDMVHEMDERLDQYETAGGTKKAQSTKKTFGTANAGPIPNSKLADQDLEGETRKSVAECPSCGFPIVMITRFDGQDFVSYKNQIARNHCVCSKNSFEQTGKQLQTVAEKAEEVETTKQKTQLIGKIKEIQLKRQKAVITEREETTSKSFRDLWKKTNLN